MTHFEFLGLLCKEVEAKAILDTFIKDMHKEYNSTYKDESYINIKGFFEKKLIEFNHIVDDLYKSFGLDQDVIKFYFNMEKVIVPIMIGYVKLESLRYFNICVNSKQKRFRDFDGGDIHYLYMDEANEACFELEANAHLFPETTKKYLLKKKEEREMSNFDSLDNDFQARIFVSKFDEKFKIGKFRIALKGFVKSCDWEQRQPTLTRLHNSVHKRYSSVSDKEKELVDKFLVEVASEIYSGEWWYLSQLGSNCVDLLEPLMSNKPLKDSFIKFVINSGNPDVLAILCYFISDKDNEKACEEHIELALINDSKDNLLSFSSLDKDFLNLAVEKSKLQFLAKNFTIKKFLAKHGKISNNLIKIS